MKQRLDDKMWKLYGHCFDCQVKFENKLRIDGTFAEWQENKILQNKISFIRDAIEQVKEFKKMKAPEFHNNVGVNYPELETEKWDMNVEAMQKLADEALETYNEILENLEKMEKKE